MSGRATAELFCAYEATAEKEIIRGSTQGALIYPLIFLIIGIIIIPIAIWGGESGNLADIVELLIAIAVLFVVTSIVLFFYVKNCEIIVTNKRVYGKASFGRQVDLPLDTVSAVALGMFKSIGVATSSGKIRFIAIENRDNIYTKISKLLSDRQSDIPVNVANTIVQETSAADEIKKYKELLDEGIITQEEFDVKKKQLLGL